MNLTDTPTIKQLKAILTRFNDDAANHILFVDLAGNVGVEALTQVVTAAEWDLKNDLWTQFRFEVFPPGYGYVGRAAANDSNWMNHLYTTLAHNWHHGNKRNIGSLDEF
jgi:hypothetical protein